MAIVKDCPLKPDVAYMPIPRCETCAYWKTRDGIQECDRAIEGTYILDQSELRFYVYTNDDPSGVGLATRADFGCVEWKAKS